MNLGRQGAILRGRGPRGPKSRRNAPARTWYIAKWEELSLCPFCWHSPYGRLWRSLALMAAPPGQE